MNAELLQIIYDNEWLTPRERQIFALKFKDDKLNYQIAEELNISKETVGRDLAKIRKKMKPIVNRYYMTH